VQLRGKHALLVEDNPVNRAVFEGHLTAFGMHVASAQHGAQGLQLLRAAAAAGRQFDVVVVDHRMPVMDGATMIEQLRAEPPLRQLPVLMLTSIDDSVELEHVHSAGPQLQLAKPVRQSDLAHALAQALGQGAHGAGTMPDEHRLHGIHVLLAEDNVVNQEVVRAMLADYGCALEVAADGEQALHLLRSKRFDLVLMDCQMPRVDGFDVVRQLRAASCGEFATAASVAIIALTANALAGDAQRCVAAGFSDYLAKPVRRERLVQTLLRWVAPAEGQAALPAPRVAGCAAMQPPAQIREPAAVVGEPVLDMAVIENIRQMQRRGAADLLPRLLALFEDTASKLVTGIDAAVDAGDGEAIRRAAHSLKSASGNLGAARFSRWCGELESLGHGGRLVEARALWQRARADYVEVVSALRALVEGDSVTV
jgi:CheY-like chemotaxis protein/HPt (histidine-containing phosphotransfer) domain-containing protein